jgi:DNA-binding NarL/FixJ family response regulator
LVQQRHKTRVRQLNREAPVRRKVLARLSNGWSKEEIALHLGVSVNAVKIHLYKLCREEGVADVPELAKKLKFAKAPPPNRPARVGARRMMLVEMLLADWAYKEIGRKLGVSASIIADDVRAIYRRHGVKGRSCVANKRMLAEKLGLRYVSRGDEVRSKAAELRERGLTWKEVAREMGMTPRGVRAHLGKGKRREAEAEGVFPS